MSRNERSGWLKLRRDHTKRQHKSIIQNMENFITETNTGIVMQEQNTKRKFFKAGLQATKNFQIVKTKDKKNRNIQAS